MTDPADRPWWADDFTDDALGEESDLSLHVHAGLGAEVDLRSLELTCVHGELSALRRRRSQAEDRADALVVSMDAYLGVWSVLRASGLLDAWMEGSPPPAGTDVYVSGHAGAAGLGFTVSTDAATVKGDEGLSALVAALEALSEAGG